jgi:phosphotransferase system  glucose/maltose/N-acetylglucosamine-specific IIC component
VLEIAGRPRAVGRPLADVAHAATTSPVKSYALGSVSTTGDRRVQLRRFLSTILVVALAGAVHLDWHLARPAHHHRRLSLGWDQHWLLATIVFAVVGWIVARVWPERPWRPGLWIAALALFLAQGVEPASEVALYARRLGYPDEPGRWSAFFVCIAVGLPAYGLALWLCRPAQRRGEQPSLAPAT